jgi:hypothetical protein
MAKRPSRAESKSERQKIIAAVMEWEEPATWKFAFNLGAEFHKYKASAAQNRELARKYPTDPIWVQKEDRDEEDAETYRQQVVQLHAELLAIENYLLRNEPDLFPLLPSVDFFGEPPADVLPLAERMQQLESALRVRMAQPSGDDAAAARESTAAKPPGREWLEVDELAKALGIHETRRQAFFMRLSRERPSLGDDCYKEVRNRRANEARFLYNVNSPKLQALAAEYRHPRGRNKSPDK